MVGPELHMAVSFSLIFGMIVGALLCHYFRMGRTRLIPGAAAAQACQQLRAGLASLQEALQQDGFHAPQAKPQLPAPGPFPAAPAIDDDDPPISSKIPINEGAWRRLASHPPAIRSVAPVRVRVETGMIAPVRRRPSTAAHTASIDARMAEELVWRHFGVPVEPLQRPAAEQSGKVLRMPPAQSLQPSPEPRQSLAR